MTDVAAARAGFWDFVAERDSIALRRAAGQSEPWTDDTTLRDYHFTNVHRHKDPGTRWIAAEVERQGLVRPLDLLIAAHAYRGLNRVSTFERFGLPRRDELGPWLAELRAAQRAGVKIGSGRHLTFLARLERSLPALARSGDTLADRVWAARDGIAAVGLLIQCGWMLVGPFAATQIVADLVTFRTSPPMGRETIVPLSAGSYVASGPLRGQAVSRGDNYEHSGAGRAARRFSPERDRDFMVDLLAGQPELSERMTYVDLEHCLCEYARYERLRADGGGTGLLRRTKS